MDDTEIFGMKLMVMIILGGIIYLLFVLSPVIWSAIRAFNRSKPLLRPWLFVGAVSCLVYGAVSLLFFVLLVPLEFYFTFIAPQLEAAGRSYGKPLVESIRLVENYWILAVPLIFVLATIVITRKLATKWEKISAALEG